jgi:hypothetical protein
MGLKGFLAEVEGSDEGESMFRAASEVQGLEGRQSSRLCGAGFRLCDLLVNG